MPHTGLTVYNVLICWTSSDGLLNERSHFCLNGACANCAADRAHSTFAYIAVEHDPSPYVLGRWKRNLIVCDIHRTCTSYSLECGFCDYVLHCAALFASFLILPLSRCNWALQLVKQNEACGKTCWEFQMHRLKSGSSPTLGVL
jgi:hypothetical protein